jgi:hypothetical protein
MEPFMELSDLRQASCGAKLTCHGAERAASGRRAEAWLSARWPPAEPDVSEGIWLDGPGWEPAPADSRGDRRWVYAAITADHAFYVVGTVER